MRKTQTFIQSHTCSDVTMDKAAVPVMKCMPAVSFIMGTYYSIINTK